MAAGERRHGWQRLHLKRARPPDRPQYGGSNGADELGGSFAVAKALIDKNVWSSDFSSAGLQGLITRYAGEP